MEQCIGPQAWRGGGAEVPAVDAGYGWHGRRSCENVGAGPKTLWVLQSLDERGGFAAVVGHGEQSVAVVVGLGVTGRRRLDPVTERLGKSGDRRTAYKTTDWSTTTTASPATLLIGAAPPLDATRSGQPCSHHT